MRANTQNSTGIVPWELSTEQKRGNQPSCFRHSKLVWNREMTLFMEEHIMAISTKKDTTHGEQAVTSESRLYP
jgi:hypothetical protein